MMIVTRSHWLGPGFGLKTQRKRVRNTIRMSHGHPHVVLYVLGCTRAALMYSTRADTQMVELVVALDTRSGEILCFVYTMVIKTELWTRVHSPVVRAADCRSAGPWFNSGWRHWIHIHWHVQRNNIMSPITTTITMPMTTIPRKSVNMVAELALWIPDTTERQEDYGRAEDHRQARGVGEARYRHSALRCFKPSLLPI